jgi:ribosome recycling factor
MDYNIREKFEKAIEAMERNFTTVRAGRANPAILDGISVSYYGMDTPLKQLANVSIPEARQLLIKPFDRSLLGPIEKAIFEANIGFTPNNDGENIRIIIPPLTEERRIELTKQVKTMAEEGKVAIRNIRHDIIDGIKKEALPEDEEKQRISKLQDYVDEYNKKVEEKLKQKETELLSV